MSDAESSEIKGDDVTKCKSILKLYFVQLLLNW